MNARRPRPPSLHNGHLAIDTNDGIAFYGPPVQSLTTSGNTERREHPRLPALPGRRHDQVFAHDRTAAQGGGRDTRQQRRDRGPRNRLRRQRRLQRRARPQRPQQGAARNRDGARAVRTAERPISSWPRPGARSPTSPHCVPTRVTVGELSICGAAAPGDRGRQPAAGARDGLTYASGQRPEDPSCPTCRRPATRSRATRSPRASSQQLMAAEREGSAFLAYRDEGGSLQFFSPADRDGASTIGRRAEANLCIGWDSQVPACTRKSTTPAANGRSPTTGSPPTAHTWTSGAWPAASACTTAAACASGARSSPTVRRRRLPSARRWWRRRARPSAAHRHPAERPGGALPAVSGQRLRHAGHQSGDRGELFLSVDAVKMHLRTALREVRPRRPAAEPEAGATGRDRPAERRGHAPRARLRTRARLGEPASETRKAPPERGFPLAGR